MVSYYVAALDYEDESGHYVPGYLCGEDVIEAEACSNVDAVEPLDVSILTIAMVVRVIDGDSIELQGGECVRFIGVDAPEVGESGSG